MVPAQNVLTNRSESYDLLLNCDHNPGCLASRVIPALKSVERMAHAREKTINATVNGKQGYGAVERFPARAGYFCLCGNTQWPLGNRYSVSSLA